MGFTVPQVNAMTLWEFDCQVRGWMVANGQSDKPKHPTEEEFEFAVANSRIN